MQNSGNPVLDSLVNIVTSGEWHRQDGHLLGLEDLKALHKVLRKLALKEPNGLKPLPFLPSSASE